MVLLNGLNAMTINQIEAEMEQIATKLLNGQGSEALRSRYEELAQQKRILKRQAKG